MEITEIILAYGHKNIQATHKSTFEITREPQLSERGDCVIAVGADKAVGDLSPELKRSLQKDNAEITMLIEAGEAIEVVNGIGTARLILTHPTDIVVRKSSYICNRTLAIQSDKAAYELSREFVLKLRKPKQKVKITLIVKV